MAPVVPAHDITTAGPATDPAPPKPGSIQRSSTILSQSSGQTSFSLTIKAKAHHPCPNPKCNASSLGLQSFHFSRRQSIRNPLQCSKCDYVMMYIGGSPPASRSPTFDVGAEANTSRKRPSIPGLSHRPSIGSALAMGGLTASSVAFSGSNLPDSDDVQTHDFQPELSEGKSPAQDTSEEAEQSAPARKSLLNQEREKRPNVLRNLLLTKLSRANMKRFVIRKLNVTIEDLEPDFSRPSVPALQTMLPSPLVALSQHREVVSIPEDSRRSSESMQVKPADSVSELDPETEQAKISAHLGSHNGPRHSQERLSLASLRGLRHEFIGGAWSQNGGSELSLARLLRRNRNRDSTASYGSHLSSGERSDVQPPRRPQAPQAPHASAAGPSTVLQVPNGVGQQERNQRDSFMEE